MDWDAAGNLVLRIGLPSAAGLITLFWVLKIIHARALACPRCGKPKD